MQIYNSLDELNITDKTSAALGNFDGLHIGHRKIMEDAINSAADKGIKSLCFTFSNHPFNFILNRTEDDPHAIKMICTEEEKIGLIGEMGFDILVNIPFDESIMSMSADSFFKDVICARLNAGCVSAGFNYSYGARAGGSAETLRKECENAGIDVNIHDAVSIDDVVVSSTLIRDMISFGDMEKAAMYLGRSYSISGKVAHGRKLGSAMGIPTVNIPAPEGMILPPKGVYYSRILIDGREYRSVSNIGTRPSVDDDTDIKTETNIFDFESDIYSKEVRVYFDHFARAEARFDTKEELFVQIAEDCRKALEYHKKR